MKAVLGALAFAILLAGCQRNAEPILAYGKSVEHWLGELRKPSPRARKKAVAALGHVGTAEPLALPAVIEALKDSDAGVRDEAVLTLAHLGAGASEAVPALTEVLADKDPMVREHAARALERIQAGK
jgi:HEAT repeat protein